MRLSEIKRDLNATEQGAWVGAKYDTPIPGMGDLNLKVRGDNNADWRRLQAKLIAALPHSKRINGLSPEDNDRITGECLKRACLLDWDGVEDDEGKPVEYSPEQAATIIDDPRYAEFRLAVLWAASLVGKQLVEQLKADAKN